MDFSIRQGETLTIAVTAQDETAQTLDLVIADSNNNVVIHETTSFSTTNGVRGAEISTNDTDLDLGDYQYMLQITYEDGTIQKLPDADNCESADCELPTLTICKALDVPEVS